MSRVVSEASVTLTADSRVDVEAGVIRGAKVLGIQSRNRRTYPDALLRERHAIYEGAAVFADHDYQQLRTGRARPLSQWGGVLRSVCHRPGSGIFGDVHCLKQTDAGRTILEAAARMPERFRLSAMHLIDSRKEADGSETVTALIECWSVDAVTRPATTRTLFEEEEPPMADDALPPPDPGAAVAAATMSVDDAFMALQNAVMA